LHSPQVHGFFSVPTDPLTARHLFIRKFRNCDLDFQKTIVISPDVGRAKPAARFAKQLGLPVAAAQKERFSDFEVKIGDTLERQVKGFRCAVVYDDEIVTGTTVYELCSMLIDYGIKEIYVICTHGLFAGDSLDRLCNIREISKIVTTDTVPIPEGKNHPKLDVISVAQVFGEAIWLNFTRQSIGSLYSFHDEGEE